MGYGSPSSSLGTLLFQSGPSGVPVDKARGLAPLYGDPYLNSSLPDLYLSRLGLWLRDGRQSLSVCLVLAGPLRAPCPQLLHCLCTLSISALKNPRCLPGSISGQPRVSVTAPGREQVSFRKTKANTAGAPRGAALWPHICLNQLPTTRSAPQPTAARQPLSAQRRDDW